MNEKEGAYVSIKYPMVFLRLSYLFSNHKVIAVDAILANAKPEKTINSRVTSVILSHGVNMLLVVGLRMPTLLCPK